VQGTISLVVTAGTSLLLYLQ